MATVGIVALCCVAVRVVAWPHFVLQVLLLCGCSGHYVVVTFVAWLRWVSLHHVVLWSGLLHGCSGCRHAVLCYGQIIVWLWWVSSHCVVSWLRLLCSCDGCCCAMLCHGRRTACGVVGIALHVVLWALHCIWCCRCHTVCGAVGITLYVVSWASQASHRMVSQALHHI